MQIAKLQINAAVIDNFLFIVIFLFLCKMLQAAFMLHSKEFKLTT